MPRTSFFPSFVICLHLYKATGVIPDHPNLSVKRVRTLISYASRGEIVSLCAQWLELYKTLPAYLRLFFLNILHRDSNIKVGSLQKILVKKSVQFSYTGKSTNAQKYKTRCLDHSMQFPSKCQLSLKFLFMYKWHRFWLEIRQLPVTADSKEEE